MKRTAVVFAILLMICLVIGACSKQAEVEKQHQEIPAAKQAPDSAMIDTMAAPDSGMIDSLVSDTGSATR